MKRSVFLFFIFLILVLLFSCEQTASAQYGSMCVLVSGGSTRTVEPAEEMLAITGYKITGTHSTLEEVTVEKTFTSSSIQLDDLAVGEWSFVVEGYNSDGIVVASSGNKTVNIAVNGVTNVSYRLDWFESGEGTLKVSILVQSSRVSTIECLLTNVETESNLDVITLSSPTASGLAYLFEESFTVPTGYYRAAVTMKDKDGKQVGITLHPSVHIYKDLTATYEFSWEKLSYLLAVDAPKTDIEAGGTVDCNGTISLTAEETGAEIYYSFDGQNYSKYDGPIDITDYASESSITLYTYSVTDSTTLSDTASYTFSVNHVDLGTATYTWTETSDGYSCTGTIECNEHTGNKIAEETASATVVITAVATCTEEGEGIFTAEFTNSNLETQTSVRKIEKMAHDFISEIVADEYLKTVATCVESAVYYKSCSMCGLKSEEEFHYGSPAEHDFIDSSDLKYLKSGSCCEEAVFYKSCSFCGMKSEETFTYGTFLNHDFIEEIDGSIYMKTSPTCTQYGIYYKSCMYCGLASTTETFDVEPLGHNYINYRCDRCSLWKQGPTGGYVFYDCDADNTDDDPDGADNLLSTVCGWRYLEAAPNDLDSTYVFGYYRETSSSSIKTVGTSTAVGTGKANTQALVKAMGSSSGTSAAVYAAKACDSYSLEVNGVTYDNWFLPSKDELYLMYANLKCNGLSTWSTYYWSSSEKSWYTAWGQYFSSGSQYDDDRGYDNYVRPIRAFL